MFKIIKYVVYKEITSESFFVIQTRIHSKSQFTPFQERNFLDVYHLYFSVSVSPNIRLRHELFSEYSTHDSLKFITLRNEDLPSYKPVHISREDSITTS